MSKELAKIIDSRYHRNGIGGEGFHAVTFEYGGKTLFATIAYAEDGESLDPYSCRVVNPLNLGERWCGDLVGHSLAQHVKTFEQLDDDSY